MILTKTLKNQILKIVKEYALGNTDVMDFTKLKREVRNQSTRISRVERYIKDEKEKSNS